ncbi:hypothetical protein P7K49_024686 [Saguinus oedipus]|uniref:Uncharacterized protein n=1 Tax=Saguinus oedipus TaxID=9490 RepID=A0ABQ9UQZ7_SAGOE|nr:hypothetical protein P7K49_024686 [Saguinus oedipus]
MLSPLCFRSSMGEVVVARKALWGSKDAVWATENGHGTPLMGPGAPGKDPE